MPAAFAPDEINHSAPTSKARLKWVIAVREDIPAGAAANAIACVGAGITTRVPGLIAPGPTDAGGRSHYALPWAGCTILATNQDQLTRIRDLATRDDTEVVAMPQLAQDTRVFAEVEAGITAQHDPELLAVAVVGPRNAISRIVRKLPLYGDTSGS
jgi:hypothetical protein